MTFEQFAENHGLKLEAVAIPFRSGPGSEAWDEDKPARLRPLHFACTLSNRNGAPVWRGEYSCGSAHPLMWAQKAAKTRHGARLLSGLSFDQRRRLPKLSGSLWGTRESVMDAETREAVREIYARRAPLEAGDILESLAMDWQSVDSEYCDGFEDWAANMGADEDSRKAEAVFNHIRETARKARRTLGADVFRELLTIEAE